MLKIGITGGIGSGKTTVCRIFERKWGIPVYYADDRAKWLMVNKPELVEAIKQEFGNDAYLSSGEINRAYISATVFGNQDKLLALNALVHPAVFVDGEEWMQAQEQTGVPYALKEAALLVETGSYQLMDKLIVVTAPLDIRIQRTMLRDNVDETAVRARIAKQLPDEDKIKLAHFVVHNDDGMERLEQQAGAIHTALLEKFEEKR